jgi:hypothetical protein
MLINITVTLSIRFVCITMSCIKVLFYVLLQRGDRECHIVVLTDEDVVDWDEEYPPRSFKRNLCHIKKEELQKY